MNQSNCSHCGKRKGNLFLGNKKWCDVCWDKAHMVFSTSYEELTNRRNLINGMRDAGWQITKNGNMYYPDDEHSNVFHMNY